MGTVNFRGRFSVLVKLLVVTVVNIFLPVPTTESIVKEVFSNFNFRKQPGLLQFWACSSMPSSAEDSGCYLILTDQTYLLTGDHEGLLQDYRRRCLENDYPFVGVATMLGNWLAGRAAQTKIADHRTIYHVLKLKDKHSAGVGGKGQLVLPVFRDQGAGNEFLGIIEYVTLEPKESYVEDFDYIHNLLKIQGLKSNYMGKTIKVQIGGHIIKFTLPLSAEFADLKKELTERFKELEDHNFRVEYDDTEGNRLPISSDEDLYVCLADSSSKGATVIRMRVMLNT